MSQMGRLEVQAEIKSPADKFYDIFRNKAYLMSKICPHHVKNIQLLHGDWGSVGSVKIWTYVAGSSESVKETVEAIDEKSRSITSNIIEGEILKYYKSYKSTIHVITNNKNQGTNLVKWRLEYVKLNETIPDPIMYLDFLLTIIKTVDAYLEKN